MVDSQVNSWRFRALESAKTTRETISLWGFSSKMVHD